MESRGGTMVRGPVDVEESTKMTEKKNLITEVGGVPRVCGIKTKDRKWLTMSNATKRYSRIQAERIQRSTTMEVTSDPSNSGFNGVVGWKLHYS